jgi:PIN domain
VVLPVVADADTLFGTTTRGLLIHLDYRGMIRLHWSARILNEMSRALVDTRRKPDHAAARKHEALMRASLPHAEVPTADVQSQFEAVAWAMRSARDIHVAACANVLRVQHYYPETPEVSLITRNIRDFGVKNLASLGINVQRPDPFLLRLISEDEHGVAAAFAALRATLRSNPTPDQLLARLGADGQTGAATALLSLWQTNATVL